MPASLYDGPTRSVTCELDQLLNGDARDDEETVDVSLKYGMVNTSI